MSGFFGKTINSDDGYIGTLNTGALVFATSTSNPIPNNASGIYVNNDSIIVSNPGIGTAILIVENTLSTVLDSYVDNQTFQENKNAWNEIDHQILQALDGYMTSASSGVSEQTFQENKNAQLEINYQLLVSLDGYASKITEAEHYTQLSQAIQDVVSTIDGYSTDIEFAGLTTTVEEHKNYQNQFNQLVVQALDGYVTTISGLDNTELQHTQQQNQINQTIIQVLDGYAALISGLDTTELQHTQYQEQFNQTIVQALDGYSTLISGLDATELQHTQQQNQINQTIIQALDGYTGGSGVSETTFQENKNAQEQINQTILQALDGYTTSVGSGVSEQTFQENKDAWNEIDHQILSALDGYAAVQGTATQIAYFSGTNTLTSDTNLSYDTTNNRLIAYSLQITGGPPDDGYVLTSDASGIGTWKRPVIAFATDKIYTVDATHPAADFTTIQAAINHASDGYIILVSPGTYNEQLNLRAGITMEIRGTGPDYAQANLEFPLSGDGYVVSGPDAGAGSIVFKNMNISLRYNGLSGSTATILARSSSFGWIFRDCYISTYTLSASGGQTHTILANAAPVMEFWNCEIVADDNDGINNVEAIRQAAANIALYNTTVYGMDNYDIHVDDPAAVLTLDNSYIGGALNVVRAQNVIFNRVSHVGTLSNSGIIHDDDNDTTILNRIFGVGLTNGTNDFYKLHLRELGGDVTTPGDGQIWYNRAAGRFRMKEGGTVKDMIPYSTLDGYGGGTSVTEAPGFTGSDGYVAFFTGDNQIAGDNDLFYDRANSRLGINTGAPSYPLHIVGDSKTDTMRVTNDFDGYVAHFFNDGDSPNRVGIAIQCGQDTPSTGGTAQHAFSAIFVACFEGDNTLTGQLSATTAGVVAIVDLSDERAKTNIIPTRVSGLEVIKNLQLIEYNRKKKHHSYDKVEIGFSAQNCQKVYPPMVQTMMDGRLGTSRSELIPIIVKAVQEQQSIIEAQQKQIDELKKLVQKLIKE